MTKTTKVVEKSISLDNFFAGEKRYSKSILDSIEKIGKQKNFLEAMSAERSLLQYSDYTMPYEVRETITQFSSLVDMYVDSSTEGPLVLSMNPYDKNQGVWKLKTDSTVTILKVAADSELFKKFTDLSALKIDIDNREYQSEYPAKVNPDTLKNVSVYEVVDDVGRRIFFRRQPVDTKIACTPWAGTLISNAKKLWHVPTVMINLAWVPSSIMLSATATASYSRPSASTAIAAVIPGIGYQTYYDFQKKFTRKWNKVKKAKLDELRALIKRDDVDSLVAKQKAQRTQAIIELSIAATKADSILSQFKREMMDANCTSRSVKSLSRDLKVSIDTLHQLVNDNHKMLGRGVEEVPGGRKELEKIIGEKDA